MQTFSVISYGAKDVFSTPFYKHCAPPERKKLNLCRNFSWTACLVYPDDAFSEHQANWTVCPTFIQGDWHETHRCFITDRGDLLFTRPRRRARRLSIGEVGAAARQTGRRRHVLRTACPHSRRYAAVRGSRPGSGRGDFGGEARARRSFRGHRLS